MNDHVMQLQSQINFPKYKWPEGKSCAVVFSLDLDAESPYLWISRGKHVPQLGEVEQRRYGPRQGVLRVVELLSEFNLKASFYVPGVVAKTYPELLPFLTQHGHEVAYHGYFHERIDDIPMIKLEEYLVMTQELFKSQIGLANLGYRAPSWEMSSEFLEVMKRHGVAYDSSLMGFDHPYTINGLTEIPVQWMVDDALYFRYTNSTRDKTHPANPNAVLESWIEEFEAIRETGGLFMITVHDWISGRAQRIRMLRKLLKHIGQYSDVWYTRTDHLAAWHQQSVNESLFHVSGEPMNTQFEIRS
jgi:peptidoglycan/xylan/chitin deacetylase (PgdA/CDA1 family)